MPVRSTQLKEAERTEEAIVPVRAEPLTLRGLGAQAKGKVQELLARCGFGGSRKGSTLESWLRAQSKLLSSEAPGMIGFIQSDKAVFVDAAVQGFRAEDLEVSVEAFRVTIWGRKGTSRRENLLEAAQRPLRLFHVLELPVEVDGSKSTATLRQGTLHIVLPKTGRDSKISG